MKKTEWNRGIVTSSLSINGYFRCSKCNKIFEIGDNVNTKTDECDYNICDECFKVVTGDFRCMK